MEAQDTVNVRFGTGEDHTTLEQEFNFRVTSLIDGTTRYIHTIATNYAKRIATTSTIFTATGSSAEDQFSGEDYALRSFKAAEALGETVITGWGKTLWVIIYLPNFSFTDTVLNYTSTSPASSYIYPTVNILAVPAVTLTNGQSACATVIRNTHFGSYGKSSRPFSTGTILPSGNSKVFLIQFGVHVQVLNSAEDLTTISAAFTVTSAGCFHPDACPLNNMQGTSKTVPPTAHNPIQSPAFGAGVSTQAAKTTFPSGLKNPQRETSTLPPTATSTGSAPRVFPPTITSIGTGNPDANDRSPADSPPVIPIIKLGSQIIAANSALEFELGSQTLVPGGDPIIFSSTTYSLAPSATAIIVNAVSSALIPVSLQGLRTVIGDGLYGLSHLADGSDLQVANNPSPYIVGGQTVKPGFAPILVSGTTYSLDYSASTIFVNNVASPLAKFEESRPRFAPILSIGSERLTANAASEYIVNGQTLSPAGSPIVVSGTTYSLADQASELVFNGVTSTLAANQQINLPSRRVLSIGSLLLTADAKSDYILDSQTLSPGGNPIVVSGTTYSLDPQASFLVINGVTSSLPAEQAAKPTPEPVIKVGSQYLTADPALRYAFAGKTLIPNARPIVVSGTTYSLAPQATALVVNGVTSILPGYESLPTIPSKNTPASQELDYIIGSETLSPGAPAITISGIAISLAASGNTIVIDGSASPFPTKAAPSFTVGSQLITLTPVSRSIAGDETLRATAVTTSSGNNDTASLALDLRTGSNSSPLSATTYDANGNGNPGLASKGEAGRVGLGLVGQMLGVSLGVLGLALL
ncbi:hypothetical protein MMC22_002894 [Lobaria immixta]|nr:hypothetical protein [Lobaria immixta]